MAQTRMRTRLLVLVSGATMAAIGIAGCSSSPTQPSASPTTATPSASQTSATTSASPAPSKTVNTAEFNKQIQGDLADVGCYPGGVDGTIGPETDAAIREFQSAKGLAVTGELTPQTVAALQRSAKKGETVCKQTASPTATVTPAGAACTAASLAGVLPAGSEITNYKCAGGWAGGWYETKADQDAPDIFFAHIEGDQWVSVSPGQICGTASAGLPPSILKFCQT